MLYQIHAQGAFLIIAVRSCGLRLRDPFRVSGFVVAGVILMCLLGLKPKAPPGAANLVVRIANGVGWAESAALRKHFRWTAGLCR
jgi:hypothetical protein